MAAFTTYADFKLLKTSVTSSGVANVYIANPPMNIITAAVLAEYVALIPMLAKDRSVRATVFKSAVPKFHMAHFDVETLANRKPGAAGALEATHWAMTPFHATAEALRTMPKPTIAMINGRVGGGGSELMLSCDMRFAGPDAVFNQPEVALGILPGGSGTVRLARLCGRSRAMEIVLSSDDWDAEEAKEYGWVNRSFKTAEALERYVDRLAERIAKFEVNAVMRAKQCVLRAEKGIVEDLLAEQLDFVELIKVDNHPENKRLRKFLEIGGQTVEGESKLGELCGKL